MILNGDLSPRYLSGPYNISLGSSIYSSYNFADRAVCYIHLDRWTDLVLSEEYPGKEARFSFSSNFVASSEVNIIAGILYAKGRIPLLRFGISILTGQPHTFITGFQTGPVGFWLGYKLETHRLSFIFSMQTSGVFGYEPGSSFKYYLN